MPYAIGVVLALLTALFLRSVGFDRDRAVYPTLLIVTASYYVLFGVMGGSRHALSIESIVLVAFALMAVLGFAVNLWWVVAALAAHGVFDFAHSRLIANHGVPAWWPAFCLACLAALLIRRHLQPRRAVLDSAA